METFQAIYERRSTRTFERGKVIPQQLRHKILNAALWAMPAPTGEYPWRLLVVRDESTKKLVADCAQEVARTMFGGSYEVFSGHLWYMPQETQLRVAEYTTTGELWRYPEDCDMLVIPILCRTDWASGLGGLLRSPELLAPYLGFAAENMWLVASINGVGAAYNGMPLVDVRRREMASSLLGIPSSWEPTGGFAFGYSPGVRASGPSRAPLEAVAYSEYWGNPWTRKAFTGSYERIETPKTDVLDTMENLRVVRSFNSGRVEEWVIERILDTAVWGPIPENFKDWRYIVIRDDNSKEFLYRLVSERKHTPFYFNDPEWQYARLWYVEEEKRLKKLEEIMERGIGEWYRQADTLIIPIGSHLWADSAHIANVIGCRAPMRRIANGCCAQNMMIAATALGLGVNFDPTPVHESRSEEVFREFFGIPYSWVPLGVLGLGYPGEKEEQHPKPPLSSLVYDDYWGNPYHAKT